MKERKKIIVGLIIDIAIILCQIIAAIGILRGVFTHNMECMKNALILLLLANWSECVVNFINGKLDYKKVKKEIIQIIIMTVGFIMVFR